MCVCVCVLRVGARMLKMPFLALHVHMRIILQACVLFWGSVCAFYYTLYKQVCLLMYYYAIGVAVFLCVSISAFHTFLCWTESAQ